MMQRIAVVLILCLILAVPVHTAAVDLPVLLDEHGAVMLLIDS